MSKISVLREVTELTGTELLDAYDGAADIARADLRAELLRRIDPPKDKPRQMPEVMSSMMKGRK